MNNKDYQDDPLVNYCIQEMVYIALIKGFRRNGIEGTEELIKKNFEGKRRKLMLDGYKQIVFGR